MSKTDSLHYQLCCEGAKWLFRSNHRSDKCCKKDCYNPQFCQGCFPCYWVAVELNTYGGENTDVWGYGGGESVVIEVKTSHTDFLADLKKWARGAEAAAYDMQAGQYKWYLCPEGIIKPEELPDKWGLLYWDGKCIKRIVPAQRTEHTDRADIIILTSLMRRENFPKKIFNYRGQNTTIKPKNYGKDEEERVD